MNLASNYHNIIEIQHLLVFCLFLDASMHMRVCLTVGQSVVLPVFSCENLIKMPENAKIWFGNYPVTNK